MSADAVRRNFDLNMVSFDMSLRDLPSGFSYLGIAPVQVSEPSAFTLLMILLAYSGAAVIWRRPR